VPTVVGASRLRVKVVTERRGKGDILHALATFAKGKELLYKRLPGSRAGL